MSTSVNLREQHLGGLQSLRALAALGVVLQHAIYYACLARNIDFQPYLRIGFGGIGVNLFFVISGLVMAGCTYQGKAFLWHRIRRIYPGYWLAILVSGLLLIAIPTQHWTLTIGSLSLFPIKLNASYHIPYWTLVYEMGFYLVVALLIALGSSQQAMSRFSVLWLLVLAITSRYVTLSIAEPGWLLWLAPHNVFFITGFLVGLHYKPLITLPSLPLCLTAITLITLGETLYEHAIFASFLVAAPGYAACILLGIRYLHQPWLQRIGDASYGIYLIHAPLLVVIIFLLNQILPTTMIWLLIGLSILLTFPFAYLFGQGEFHLHRWLKQRGKRPFWLC